ncbi:hypothetical protein QJQ45_003986 [Haematococcus lacustris]|nr:hypothetical protein QJQ45_003986 [Haematococcus lacustris]
MATVAHEERHPSGAVESVWQRTLTAGQYYRQSGITQHAKTSKVWMAGIGPQHDALSQVTTYTASLERYQLYVDAVLATWPAMWAEMSKPRWSNARFRLYRHKQSTVAKFWAEVSWLDLGLWAVLAICGFERPAETVKGAMVRCNSAETGRPLALAYGSAGFSGSGSIGSKGVPVKQMLREACKHFPGRVVVVHEFRTSRVSSARNDDVQNEAEASRWLYPVRSMAKQSRIRGLMCSTSRMCVRETVVAPVASSSLAERMMVSAVVQRTSMSAVSALVLLVAVLCLAQGQGADAQRGLPPGTYTRSCSDCNLVPNKPNILFCNCTTKDGKSAVSYVATGPNCPNVANCDGQLYCLTDCAAAKPRPAFTPQGSYTASCTGCSWLDSSTFFCEACRNKNGQVQATTVSPQLYNCDVTPVENVIHWLRWFYNRDVSAALNIRRIAAGPGRPRELSSWVGRPAMPNPGRPGQEWVQVRDRGLLRKWQRRHQRQR